MRRHDIDARHRRSAETMVLSALTTPIEAGDVTIPALADCAHHQPEVEFLYPIPPPPETRDARSPGFVKGFIDLLFEHDGRVYLLDWKSDLLADDGPEAIAAHVRAHYALQASLYARALVKMLEASDPATAEARFGGVIYLFLRPVARGAHGVHFARPDATALAADEAALATREYDR
jgi:exodeoxyribonuclease V beta subunit